MLKIRLQRVGRKNDPSFRVVCTDSKKGPKSGNNVEILGSYDPKVNNIAVKADRVTYWISQGAQVSDTVNNILVKEGIIKAKKKHVSRGKKNTRAPEADLPAEASAKEDASVEVEEVPKEEAPAETPADLSSEASAKEEEVVPTAEEKIVEEKKEEVV